MRRSGAVRLGAVLVWTTLVCTGLAGGLAGCAAGPDSPRSAAVTQAGTAPTSGTGAPSGPPTGPAPLPSVAVIRPVSVSIPAIGVRSGLVPLELDGSGVLGAPVDFALAGWFTGGPTPGDPGPAVIAGHVDSRRGPAVFFRLRELRTGDAVEVRRSDGATARFRVDAVEQYSKGRFPTSAVYGPTPGRVLRLITCGGAFDAAKRSYRDNIVVFATALG